VGDDERFVGISDDKTLRLWKEPTKNYEEIPFKSPVMAVQRSEDHFTVGILQNDGTISMWQEDTFNNIWKFEIVGQLECCESSNFTILSFTTSSPGTVFYFSVCSHCMNVVILKQKDGMKSIQKIPMKGGTYTLPISCAIFHKNNNLKLFLGTETGQVVTLSCQILDGQITSKKWDDFESEETFSRIDFLSFKDFKKAIFPSGKVIGKNWHTVTAPLENGTNSHLVGTSDGHIKMFCEETQVYSNEILAHQVIAEL